MSFLSALTTPSLFNLEGANEMKTLFLFLGVIVILLLCTPVLAKECIIIVTDSMTDYQHELAHCNGWVHDPHDIPRSPPDAFVYAFDGQLTIIMAEGSSGMIIGMFTQKGTEFRYSEELAHRLCIRMLSEHNYSIPSDMVRGERRIGGCAIVPD